MKQEDELESRTRIQTNSAVVLRIQSFPRERKKQVLELIGELPHVGIEPCENGEGGGSNPNVDEAIWVGVWNSRVASVSISEVLLHCFLSIASASQKALASFWFFVLSAYLQPWNTPFAIRTLMGRVGRRPIL